MKEKKENFDAWVALIDDRIEDWFITLSNHLKDKFDYSINSLDEIEKYLIEKFVLDDLRNEMNKKEIDAIASYILKTYKLHWPNGEYVIELEDKKNVLFNRPAIITNPKVGMAFSPFQFLQSTLNLKRIGAFKQMLLYTKNKYIEMYGEGRS